MSVADRVNFKFFEVASSGSALRVGGRFKEMPGAEQQILTTTDGHDIVIVGQSQSFHAPGFVEVIGTKVVTRGLTEFVWSLSVRMWTWNFGTSRCR